MGQARSAERPQKHVRAKGCAALGCAGLLVAAVAINVTFVLNNRPTNLQIPTPVMPSPNAYDDFRRAGDLTRAMKHRSPYSMPGDPKKSKTDENFRLCAEEAPPTLRAVRAGLSREYMSPPVRSYYNDDFATQASIREVARLLIGVAEHYRRSGRHDAVEVLLDGAEMGTMMPRGGTVSHGLVGVAVQTICLSPVDALLGSLTAPELAHVALRLDLIARKQVPYGDILVEEGRR